MDLGIRDVARILSVEEAQIDRWVRSGKLPARRVNDRLRFHPVEVLEWATINDLPIKLEESSTPKAGSPDTYLSSALQSGGIRHHVHGADKATVLREIVQGLPLVKEIDREVLLELLLVRESLGSTAIGGGVAIPHPRFPLVFRAQASVALCFLEQPIDFAAADGQPVDALFLAISPTVQTHLKLLALLAAALRDADFREVIRQKASAERILNACQAVEKMWNARAVASSKTERAAAAD